MKSSIKISLLMGALVLVSIAGPVQAQAVNKLTNGKVRAYYADIPAVFKKPFAQFLEEYERRIHPDLSVTSKTILNLPGGQPPMQTDPVTMTKNDVIGNARRAYDSATGATLANDIIKMTIAEDGKSATVTSTSTVKGMNFPTSDGSPMKADSVETCEDVITLSEGGAVQLLRATCTADITILQ
ncbi:MAG: hypothetical protein ACXW30_00475 [Micavibrio sp.]